MLAITPVKPDSTRVQEDIGMKETSTEPKHPVGTRDEWLAARLKLLKAEKEHTRRGDELALSSYATEGSNITTDARAPGSHPARVAPGMSAGLESICQPFSARGRE